MGLDAAAQEPPAPVRIERETARRSLIKAMSWRAVGSIDTFILSLVMLTWLGPLFGAGHASAAKHGETAAYIAIAEVVTKIAFYFVHEKLWHRWHWGVSHNAAGDRYEDRRRSLTKAVTWRVFASIDTFLLALLFSGNVGVALSIGIGEVATKSLLYFLHERAWRRVRFGMVRD